MYKRQNNFNLLRLVLALLVIVAHVPEMIDGDRSREPLTQLLGVLSFGELAVDGFFLLSGYLIVQSWQLQPSAARFLHKRALRIYPAFLVATVLCALVVAPLGAGADYLARLDWRQLALGALTLDKPRIPAGAFDGLPHPGINNSMWTIRFEFLCYLAVLALGTLGALRRRLPWLLITAALAAAYAAHSFGLAAALGAEALRLDRPLVRLGMLFFAGGCFYLYRDRLAAPRRASAAVAAALLIAGLCSPATAELAMATLGGWLLLGFAATHTPALAAFNRLPDVSYGVYLWAWPITRLLQWHAPDLPVWGMVAATAAGSLALGVVSWYAIEKPALQLKTLPHSLGVAVARRKGAAG